MNLDNLYPSDTKERTVFFSNFWSRVDIKGPDDCWEWKGSCYEFGHGQATLLGTGKQTRAHRIAYAWVNGEIPDGLQVHHTCDNPPCCNPEHLWVGTQADNMRDMANKNRSARVGGRRRKLSEEEALAMLLRYAAGNVSCSTLATEFGVSRATAYRMLGSRPSVAKPSKLTHS